MKQNPNKKENEKKAAVWAAAATFVSALIILVLLFVLTVGSDRSLLASASIPEIQDDEEYFLEPELLVLDNPGNEDAENIDEAAPQPEGQPDPAPAEQPVRAVKVKEEVKEKPETNKAPLVATAKESDVKTSKKVLTAEEEKRIAEMQGKLKTENNGSSTGKTAAASGAGGDGISAVGNVNGRKWLGCTTWKVRLNQKTTVVVNVEVDADGKVTKAQAVSGGGSDNLRKECEKMAKTAKWTAKKGAATAKGTITFTIIPS